MPHIPSGHVQMLPWSLSLHRLSSCKVAVATLAIFAHTSTAFIPSLSSQACPYLHGRSRCMLHGRASVFGSTHPAKNTQETPRRGHRGELLQMAERGSGAHTSTANYHINQYCNFECNFCFATFEDVLSDTGVPPMGLDHEKALKVVDEVCSCGEFTKINFAGGEPLFRPDLFTLLAKVKQHGLSTSIITNGYLITPEWVDSARGLVDQVGISVDSANPETRLRMGRAHKGRFPMTNKEYLGRAELLHSAGISLKINSVVTALNCDERMAPFINQLRAKRWKVFQALQVSGQNALDDKGVMCDADMYAKFQRNNACLEPSAVTTIFEDNDAMTGSYAMIDPFGRFFDNTRGRHYYSAPIFELGAAKAYAEITIDHDKFEARGGEYSIY
uniref:Radical SAM core domain-containing protein n=1 Tax=Hemiselmis andersenii TaxID=464988 RepID=A0A6T8I7I3_HEMAN|mmetsp:Transcript_34181/g.80173  ORF Transcript_34181/g.80173 Transcript_34181/m.80173 type:complete len:388 (+) Transcript_34181:290-1453(+)